MADLSPFYIPRFLDEPERILFFTLEEMVLLLAPFGLGLFMGWTLRGLMAGFVLLTIRRRLENLPITHLIYWYLPHWLSRFNYLPPSEIRIFFTLLL